MRKQAKLSVESDALLVKVVGGSYEQRLSLARTLSDAGYQILDDEQLSATALTVSIEAGLSPRETEVLDCAAHGLTDKAIAADLGISIRTVRFHLDKAMRKLGAHNRTEAVMRSGVGKTFH